MSAEAPARAVGPVTTASAGGAAPAVVLAYVASLSGLEVPPLVSGALGLLLTIAGGLLVPARGRHE